MLFLPFLAFGQFQDSFDDGDLTNNPTWIGDLADFIVNADNEMQLDADSAGTSVIYVNAQFPDSILWEFYFNANFAPSNNNNLRIYLQSDDPTFVNGNGYYFEFGESGSGDALQFYRMDNGAGTLLGTGQLGAVGSAPADGRIQISRSAIGDWEVKVDYDGGNIFITDLTFSDNVYAGSTGSYFGLQCEYTGGNINNFTFDDFNIATLLPDLSPPTIVNVDVISEFELDVYFDEVINQGTAEAINNYIVGNSVGNPSTAILDGSNPTLVHLSFSNGFVSGQQNTLTVNGVEDLANNQMTSQDFPFTYQLLESPQKYEILINEFMADPAPPVGLPNEEFVELYNNTNKTFDLSGLTFESGGAPQVFDNAILEPGKYIILCDDENINLFTPFGDVLSFSSFPALSNGGDEIIIKNENGVVIDAISYNLDWYQDPDKSDGGWSIELIDPNSPCEFETNWSASNDSNGGTPGTENSVLGQSSSETGISNKFLNSNNQLTINFNNALDEASLTDPNNFSISPTLGILDITILGDFNNSILIEFITQPEVGVIYTLSINNLTNCTGSAIPSIAIDFINPETAEVNDILINEIMIDPAPTVGLPNVEYIELYNNSDKIFDLWQSSIQKEDNSYFFDSYILQPGEYLIVCNQTDVNSLLGFGNVLGMSSFLSLSNNADAFSLKNEGGQILDEVAYNLGWYQDGDKLDGGWSLELINPNSHCEFETNWRASVDLSGGTPGRKNSIFDENKAIPEARLVDLFVTDQEQLGLQYNIAVDEMLLTDPNNYTITPPLAIQSIFPIGTNDNQILIQFSDPMEIGVEYTIVPNSIVDCLGNETTSNSLIFGKPEIPESGEILINEILFNPQSGGVDYLELYNNSDKIFDMSKLSLGNLMLEDTSVIGITTNFLLFPASYVALTENPAITIENYFVEDPNALRFTNLPSFSDDEGNVTLIRSDLSGANFIIDEFDYNEDFHSPFLDDANGVSLERIDFNAPTQSASNWHSAAASAGFGTPTYVNSQIGTLGSTEDLLTLPKKVFSPDADGFEDLLFIQFNTGSTGYIADVRIFDSEGRFVKHLLRNELIPVEGTLRWDGLTDDSGKAGMGIYILLAEFISESGEVKQAKETFVLAAKL